MLLALIILSFCGVRNVISASATGQPQIPRQTTTPPAIGHEHEKRADPAATILGGEASSWFPPAVRLLGSFRCIKSSVILAVRCTETNWK